MSRRHIVLAVGILLVLLVHPAAHGQSREVTVGVVLDGGIDWSQLIIQPLEAELTALLGSKYRIQFPPEKILQTDWKAQEANASYNQLVSDPEVDVILGLGLLTSSVVVQRAPHAKPVILLGVLEPEVHGLEPTDQGTSGVRNLNYLLFNRSLARELEVFHDVYPYKRVGIVFFDQLLRQVSRYDMTIREVMEKNDAASVFVSVEDNIEATLDELTDVDAVYVGFLGRFEGADKKRFIGELNARGIPTFGFSVADVEMGALAAMAPAYDFLKVFRRIALNVEAILEGTDPANLPVHLSFEETLTLNMQTAREIGFSPDFTTLAQAEVLNVFPEDERDALDLKDVMAQAMTTNLDLKIETGQVRSTERDVALARSNLVPSVTLGTTGTRIDADTAEASMGRQSENTISGNARIDMLVFSEKSLGNITTKKYQLTASERRYDAVALNVVFDAATGYFNVLRAQTGALIQKQNVDLTRTNLAISKLRETVGYSGLADVYRWESRLATASTELLRAGNQVMLARIQLNRLLNRPLDGPITVRDVSLTDGIFTGYRDRKIRELIDNPESLRILTDFLIEEAFRNSPQISQIDASIAGLERTLTSLKLQRFVPSVGAFAQTTDVFSRGGVGSDFPGGAPPDPTWSVGISLSLPLFNGLSTSFNVQKTAIEIQKLQDQRAQIRQGIESGVRSALLDITVKMVNLQSSRRSAEFADKSLELVQDAYSKGGVSLVELADAQNAKLNADLAALNSVYDFLAGMLGMEKAVGRFALLSPPEEEEAFLQRLEDYLRDKEGGQ